MCWAVVYSRRLKLAWREYWPFIRKSFNLGLCYGSFAAPEGTLRAAWQAGLAAFCCAAYDVVTDWRRFAERDRELYFAVLGEIVPSWAVAMTSVLYDKEVAGSLGRDGLERGVIAVEFVTGLVGSREIYREWGLERLGILCQIVDDVLDEEQDRIRGELNCLQSVNRERYLDSLIGEEAELRALFVVSPVMQRVLDVAVARAKGMRSGTASWRQTALLGADCAGV